MIKACPNPRRECPYFYERTRGPLRGEQRHGCFSDKDHIIPQRLAKRFGSMSLEHEIIYGEDNIEQKCRWEHDIKTENENDSQLLIQLANKVMELYENQDEPEAA